MWELDCEKAECQRIDAFELWCWRRLLRVPWTARRSNQSILKEINPEYSLEGLMLKLKLQNFGHLMQRTDSLEKTLMLGKTAGRRRKGQQGMRWWDGIINSMDLSWSKLWELVTYREVWHTIVHGVNNSRARLRVRTELHWPLHQEASLRTIFAPPSFPHNSQISEHLHSHVHLSVSVSGVYPPSACQLHQTFSSTSPHSCPCWDTLWGELLFFILVSL